jgi:hypothetical protein
MNSQDLFRNFHIDYYGSFHILVSFQWKAPLSYWDEMKIIKIYETYTTKVFKEYISIN